MAFDLATAKPARFGFDLSTARPIENPLVEKIPIEEPFEATPASPTPSWRDRIAGVVEAPAAVATGLVAAPIGAAAGLARGLTGGKYGTQAGAREAEQFGGEVAERLTYAPRTQTGQSIVRGLGEAIQQSGIVGVPIPELNALAAASRPAVGALAAQGRAGSQLARNAFARQSEAPQMVGGGAAMVPEESLRVARAAELPIPPKLTKAMITRKFEDQRFERETAKMPEGEALRARNAELNEVMHRNFDAFLEGTGAEKTGLRPVGESVISAIQGKQRFIKNKVNAAYQQAREAGDMAQPVSYEGLSNYLAENEAAATTGNASMLAAVRTKLGQLDPKGTGKISINDMEELRKMAGRLTAPGTPNSAFIGDVKGLIDAATEGQGGPLYRQARRAYENYATEFKNTALVDKLLKNKPGSRDRVVAYEDVFQQSMLGGSLDDVRHLRRTLQTAGQEGQQAWKELQGQTVQYIKDQATKNNQFDINGNRVISSASLDKLVRTLDEDGKLDFIFGKQGAQQIRTVNDVAKDIYTAPPGSVNTSNTAGVLIGLLDTAVSGTAGLPLPIGTALRYGVKRVKAGKMQKQIGEALNYGDISAR
jgi:hypothetical protein